MKQVNRLATAVAMALGVGLAAPNASATIELETNGMGDTLLFPMFYGAPGVDNYFTISNNSNLWIQGHLRFRGATWSGELRDFDVILSPGDVFVFRVANIDVDDAASDADAGDAESVRVDEWEIDQQLDPRNFAYTGQIYKSCGRTPAEYGADCIKPGFLLVPDGPTNDLPAEAIKTQKTMGYVEFIGEAVLDGMTVNIMEDLLDGNTEYANRYYAGIGTHSWLWSDAPTFDNCATGDTDGNGRCDRGLSGVPNVLSGTAFIYIPGVGQGVAYNAEALVNFRTASGHGTHRIDNYRAPNYVPMDPPGSTDALATATTIHNYTFAATNYGSLKGASTRVAAGTMIPSHAFNSEVILHEDSARNYGGVPPVGDYVYHPTLDSRGDEARVSFNNTWGPTLADGDDYSAQLCAVGARACGGPDYDDWEDRFVPAGTSHALDPVIAPSFGNSIAEVEEALRADGQDFTAYYFANSSLPQGGDALHSWYVAYAPTEFYYGESDVNLAAVAGTNNPHATYARLSAEDLYTRVNKPLTFEIWDINENYGQGTDAGCISPDPCTFNRGSVLQQELWMFPLQYIKDIFQGSEAETFTTGRIRMHSLDTPLVNPMSAYPVLGYTFEFGGAEAIGQWRSMQR